MVGCDCCTCISCSRNAAVDFCRAGETGTAGADTANADADDADADDADAGMAVEADADSGVESPDDESECSSLSLVRCVFVSSKDADTRCNCAEREGGGETSSHHRRNTKINQTQTHTAGALDDTGMACDVVLFLRRKRLPRRASLSLVSRNSPLSALFFLPLSSLLAATAVVLLSSVSFA